MGSSYRPDNGGSDGIDDAVVAEINITPLTDVFLVLLIIFMVTSSVIVRSGGSAAQAGIKVDLPKGGASDVVPSASDLSVAVLSDGRLVLAGDVVSSDELKRAFDAAKEKNASTMVIVQADEGVPHGKVVEVMEMAKKAGLAQLGLVVARGGHRHRDAVGGEDEPCARAGRGQPGPHQVRVGGEESRVVVEGAHLVDHRRTRADLGPRTLDVLQVLPAAGVRAEGGRACRHASL